ncbi:MAG: hypothetical protein HRU36_04865 [Rickettsiales bacterium]|nr:hypothetical protein [Rickettsiales bacterium]
MKKVFLWSILIIIVIYAGAWFITSKVVERETYKHFSKLKKEKIIKEYSGNIDITGFPFSFNINLSHPRVKFTKKDAGYNVESDMLFDGILSVELGLFSDKIKINPYGDLHLKGKLNNYNFDYTIGGKNSYYQIRLSDSLVLTAIKGIITGKTKKLEDLIVALVDKVNIHNEELRMFNKLTNKLLIYASEIDLKLGVVGSRNKLNVEYVEHLYNAEFDKEFTVLNSEIASLPFMKKIIDIIDINIRNYFDVFSFDKLGKINHDIDLDVNIEGDLTTVKVNKLQLRDTVHDIAVKGQIGLNNTKDIKLEFRSKFSDSWYELMKIYANRLRVKNIEGLSFGGGKESIISGIFNAIFGFIKDMLQVRTSYSLYVPKLHKMGAIKGDIDLQYKGGKDRFKLNVNEFKIRTNKFLINANGNAENTGRGGDKYKLKALFTNYSHMVDSLVGYVNRVTKSTGKMFFISGKKLTISQSISDRIKFFLKEVSDDPGSNSNDLRLTVINSDGAKCPAVGKYNNKEFCSLWHGFIFNLLLLQVTKELNPEEMLKTLQDPLNIPLGITKDAGKVAKDVVGGILGGLLGQKK